MEITIKGFKCWDGQVRTIVLRDAKLDEHWIGGHSFTLKGTFGEQRRERPRGKGEDRALSILLEGATWKTRGEKLAVKNLPKVNVSVPFVPAPALEPVRPTDEYPDVRFAGFSGPDVRFTPGMIVKLARKQDGTPLHQVVAGTPFARESVSTDAWVRRCYDIYLRPEAPQGCRIVGRSGPDAKVHFGMLVQYRLVNRNGRLSDPRTVERPEPLQFYQDWIDGDYDILERIPVEEPKPRSEPVVYSGFKFLQTSGPDIQFNSKMYVVWARFTAGDPTDRCHRGKSERQLPHDSRRGVAKGLWDRGCYDIYERVDEPKLKEGWTTCSAPGRFALSSGHIIVTWACTHRNCNHQALWGHEDDGAGACLMHRKDAVIQ